MRLCPILFMAALLGAGCAGEEPRPMDWCDGSTRSLGWNGLNDGPATFPDDWLTAEEGSSATGRLVTMDQEVATWLGTVPENVEDIYGLLDGRDGWGTSAGVFLRFDGPVSGLEVARGDSESQAVIHFISFGQTGAETIPFESWTIDGGSTLMVRPLRPLEPETRHAVLVSTGARGGDGLCVRPSDGLRRVLQGEAQGSQEEALVSPWREAMALLGLRADEVSAGTVFTTGSLYGIATAVAADIDAGSPVWSIPPLCEDEDEDGLRRCEGTLLANDYRVGRAIAGAKAQAEWELEVSFWLPADSGAAHPLLLFGHGLNSDRGAGAGLAKILAPLGIGLAAVDAMHHGTHPTVVDNITSMAVFDFIAVDPERLTVDVARLHANFLQSAFDKLGVLRAITAEPDIDGDGQADVDSDWLGYYGESLGGIRASHVLALSERLKVGVIAVGGARLGTIIEEGADFGIIRVFMEEILGGADAAARFYPVMQAAVDPGDPVMFAPRVLRERLVGGAPPHLLLTAAVGDFSVPNEASADLCRALDIPVLGTDWIGVGLVEGIEEASLVANLGDGTTAAFFQYDRVSGEGGALDAADHGNVPFSAESVLQLERFLSTWLEGGPPEIINPYEALGTPGLTGAPPG